MTSGPPQPPDEPAPPPASVASEPNVTPSPVAPAMGIGFGVVALILGGLGCLLPLLPMDMPGTRAWISLPFALPGLLIGIIGCTGPRRGNVLSIAGSVLCAIAVGLSAVMLIESNQDANTTQDILSEELDVRLGDRHVEPETNIVSVTVTLYNKGSKVGSYLVRLVVNDPYSENPCEASVAAHDLPPGASIQEDVSACSSRATVREVTVQVVEAERNPI